MKDEGDFQECPGFADIDRHFGQFMARFGGDETISLAAACLSQAVRSGHVCLDLASPPLDSGNETLGSWPNLGEWRSRLGLSSAVGGPESLETPLVLDASGRLYLRRYYQYEQRLASALRSRAGRASPAEDAALREGQAAAVEAALSQWLTVISGGPGTGKTTTVVAILLRLLGKQPASRIALCAPTGKAAARLEQAVREGLAKQSVPQAFRERIPRAATLHRLLGYRPKTAGFCHGAGNPLALDLLVVDEASMVPLPMMARLFDALSQQTRVILLGDRDQLASVEPGSVLADIAEAALDDSKCGGRGLRGALVMLRENFRFGNQSAIFRLCEAVRSGDSRDALQTALEPKPDLGSLPLPAPAAMRESLRKPVLEGFGPYLGESDPAKALAAFNRFRILCATRSGTYGVEEINRQAVAILHRGGLIGDKGALPLHRKGELREALTSFYAGMPLLVTRNDYQLNLFNGDIGILLPDPAEPEPPDGGERPLWAWFPGESTGADGERPVLRRISPARLPDNEPAYAMTIHKSQGSEFERVLLVLPERDMPIMTRELIYTGLTRARSRVDLWLKESVFENGVRRATERESGLRDALGK